VDPQKAVSTDAWSAPPLPSSIYPDPPARRNEKGLLRDDRSRLLLQSLEDAWSKLVRAVAWGPPTKEEDVPAPDPLEVGKVALATWDKCLAHAALVGGSTSFLTNVRTHACPRAHTARTCRPPWTRAWPLTDRDAAPRMALCASCLLLLG
jgi:hypothetical protein